jgi:hypothetical protein
MPWLVLSKVLPNTTGTPLPKSCTNLFAVGYSPGNVVDIIPMIADKVVTNYLYSVSDFPIDFPPAPQTA